MPFHARPPLTHHTLFTPLALKADHILDSFTAAAHRIEAALGQLPIQGMESVAETAEDVATLRSTLQRMAFGLPSAHQGMLKMFRAACDAVKGHAASLEEQCHSIIRTVGGICGRLGRRLGGWWAAGFVGSCAGLAHAWGHWGAGGLGQ